MRVHFRSELIAQLGDKSSVRRKIREDPAMDGSYQWSDPAPPEVSFSSAVYGCVVSKYSTKSLTSKSFRTTTFPYANQSVTIRGVSTKLKVNSGRTIPPVSLLQGSPYRTSGIDHLDGFQVNLASTQPLNQKQRVLRRPLTLTEPACKLIRIFTPGPEPLPLMCCLPS